MKRVRKDDLKDLFHEFYRSIIRKIPEDEYIKLVIRDKLHVNANSVYVKIWWYRDTTPEINEKNIRQCTGPVIEFVEKIKEMTLGEIEEKECRINENEDIIEIYFTNGYEVID